MKATWWAVVPKGYDIKFVRIEKATTPQLAIQKASGYYRITPEPHWRAKYLGPRVSVIQSDRKRIELLTSPQGWIQL